MTAETAATRAAELAEIAASPREFGPARYAQGFRDQAHLDAFYASYDHEHDCPAGICGTPGPAAWLEGDASWQPTARVCPEGQRLTAASFAHLDRPRVARS